MNISGIRTYAGFYDYNTIKQNQVRSRQIQEAKAAVEQERALQEEVCPEDDAVVGVAQDRGAREFTEQYQPDAVYEMKGSDSDIFKLDIEKAISDMKRDEVLFEYQFFVNSAGGLGNPAVSNVTEQFVL